MIRLKPLILGIGLGLAFYQPINAAEIKSLGSQDQYVTIGHDQSTETYEIRVEEGDCLSKILQQMKRMDIRDDYGYFNNLYGPHSLTLQELLEHNPEIDNPDLIFPGQVLKYTRISHIWPGLNITL